MYQKFALELSYREIAMNLNVDASTVQRVVQRFEDTGAVEKAEYPKGHDDDLRRRLTKVDEHLIIHLVLNRPSIYLHEVQQELATTTGTHISIPTICKFLHQNGFTRKKISRVALQRSEAERVQYKSDISVYNPDMFVFVDETGTDRHDRPTGLCAIQVL